MQINLLELIKDAPNGTSIRSRGGDRYKYQRFVFFKVKKNTVYAFSGWTWKTIQSATEAMEPETIVATLTPDKITFKIPGNNVGNHLGNISAFFSLNLLHDCWTKRSYGANLIHTADFEFSPFKKMEFNWHGKLISPIPQYAQKRYNTWHKAKRDRINLQSRQRYAQNAAEREFKKRHKNGTLDEYDVKKVFTLQNAQVRQIAIEEIGLAKIMAPYETKVINKDTVNGLEYELVDILMPGIPNPRGWGGGITSEKWCLYLKMINPTTSEIHLEGIARKSDNGSNYIPEETVKGALAWRDNEHPRQGFRADPDHTKWDYQEPTILT